MSEEWREVVGYDGAYQVSNMGNVRSMPRYRRRNTISMKVQKSHDGYLVVGLHRGGKLKVEKVHLLVLAAFAGERPEGAQARHLNDNRADAKLFNLAWGTVQENMDDKKKAKSNYGERNAGAKLTEKEASEIKRRLNSGETGAALSREFGVTQTLISYIKKGRLWAQTLPAITALSS